MKKLPTFARTVIQVGNSGIDFYSFGHLIMGIIGYTILVNFFRTPDAFLFVSLGAVGWELIENVILFRLGLKYEGRRDSGLNAICDIAFVDIGAGISFGLFVWLIEVSQFTIDKFVLANLILALFIYITYFIFKIKLLHNTRSKRHECSVDEEADE
jgi:hypothetical protein